MDQKLNRRISLIRRPIVWLLVFGLWSLIALFNTSQLLISKIVEGRPIDWLRVLTYPTTGWFVWALLTPVVIMFAQRFGIVRRHLRRVLLTHVYLSVLVSIFHIIIEAFTIQAVWQLFGEPFLDVKRFIGILTFKFHLNLLIYWAIVGVSFAFDYYQKYQERQLETSKLALKASQLEAQLTTAQLQALKAQIHPHFLFNTHHAIQTLILKNENEAAMLLLTRLSDLLRLTLDNVNVQEVTLKKELEFLNLFLEIQQIRFQDRLHIQRNVAASTFDAKIPNLILQPIVENAIKHGIARDSEARLIEIKATRENERLRIQIRDDGPGIRNGDISKIEEGIGIKNTRARLHQLYGKDYQFQLTNADDGGALVVLEIPFRQ